MTDAAAAGPPDPARTTPWVLPYLLGLVLPLGVLSANVSRIAGVELYPILLGLAAAAVFDGLSRLAAPRSPVRSLLAMMGLFWFIGFGNFDQVFHLKTGASLQAAWLAWTVALAVLIGILAAGRHLPILQGVGVFLQIALLVMLGMQIFALRGLVADLGFRHDAPLPAAGTGATVVKPDIYYIILDGYGREDVLREHYGIDNREFLAELEKRGFQVLPRSRSNYNQTGLSLASALNLDYLDRFELPASATRVPLIQLLSHSVLTQLLKSQGYTTISTATGYTVTDLITYDEKVEYPAGRGWWTVFPPSNEFQVLALNLTVLNPWLQAAQCEAHRQRTLAVLESLPGLRRDGPIFVLAHLVLPHPPFLFDGDGQPVEGPRLYAVADGIADPAETPAYVAGYQQQVRLANRLVLASIDRILAASERPACIIVQGDHGPAGHSHLYGERQHLFLQERYSILNAIRADLPQPLPADLTPVNTFRILCNHYFGTQLELRPNRAIFAPYASSFQFEDVTQALEQGAARP